MKMKRTCMAAAAAMVLIAPAVQAEDAGGEKSVEARISALEAALQKAEKAASAKSESSTKISGRMYFDVTHIENRANGARVAGGGNGANFDIKRFYIGIDHIFNAIFSANVTTDTTYDSASANGQVYLKKAYLQAKIDPLLTVRLGASDLPWIPYVEGIYGFRYFEQVIADRNKFGTSSDWGVHASGSAFGGILNYAIAAVNGGGYKKIPTGGGTNRFEQFDYEGRISAVYEGFNLAIGGYTGKLGTPYGTATYHTASRFNLLGAYVADGLRLGVEYFNATDYSAALVASPTPGDGAHGVSVFGSYRFAPEWSVFSRFDSVDPNTRTVPGKTGSFFTLGTSWNPVKIVELALAYKHETARGGAISTSAGTIGSNTGAKTGEYNEVGLWGTLQF